MATPAFRIRAAAAEDYAVFRRLHAELQVEHEPPDLQHWTNDVAQRSLVLEAGGAVVAYVTIDTLAGVGYVRNLAVDPAWRRRGAGRRLLTAAAARLRRAGCDAWRLNMKVGNEPALRLYESLGFRTLFRSDSLRVPWRAVDALPPAPRPLLVRDVEPADDAALEQRFDLAPGQLTACRAMAGQILVRLDDAADRAQPALGVARFDPQFPGAYPFRVSAPPFARALLEGLRPHARPEHDHLFVLTEDDAPLAALLRAAGAAVQLEIVHLRGALPAG
jgi:ribosomal protein S18 acetylase RimI-like enzyme